MPPFLWLRLVTGQTLQALHRHHLKVQMRDAGQEVSLRGGAAPQASSASLAEMLLGRLTSPTRAARRAEMQLQLQEVLNAMEPDRPRDPGPAPLRGAEQRRDRPGAGPDEDRGEQSLHPCP